MSQSGSGFSGSIGSSDAFTLRHGAVGVFFCHMYNNLSGTQISIQSNRIRLNVSVKKAMIGGPTMAILSLPTPRCTYM